MSLTSHLRNPRSSVARFMHEKLPDVETVVSDAENWLNTRITVEAAVAGSKWRLSL